MAGAEEPLKPAVEKIARECEKAGAGKWELVRIVKELSRSSAGTAELRKRALELLQNLNPEAAKAYARFESMRIFTSSERVEGFDRGNITESLLRETPLSRTVAERISNEVEEKIKNLNIRCLDTALVREMVNAKLLELGHEDARRDYTRLGLPVSDVRERIENGAECGKEAMREYNWLKVIPARARELHFSGDLHIAAAEDFSTKPYAYSKFFEPKEERAEIAVAEIAAEMARLNGFFSLPVCADSVNVSLAKVLDGCKKSRLGEIAELLFMQMECVLPERLPSYKRPSLSANLFPEGSLERFSDCSETAIDFTNSMAGAFAGERNFTLRILLDTKYKLGLLEGGLLKGRKADFISCAGGRQRALNGALFSDGGAGISTYAGINLIKTALESRGDETAFLDSLRERFEVAGRLGKLREEILRKSKYLERGGIRADELKPALGLFGLLEAAEEIAGSRGALKTAERVLNAAVKTLPEWLLVEFGNDPGIIRFSRLNRELFGYEFREIPGKERLLESKAVREHYRAVFRAGSLAEVGELLEKGAGFVAWGE